MILICVTSQNGQDILDSLSQLKPILVESYENWQDSQRTSPGSSRPASSDPHMSREEQRAREAREAARREEAWKQAEISRKQAEERERQAREEAAWRQSQEARRREEPDRAQQNERQRRDEENRRYAAEEARREEERTKRKAVDDKRRYEQEGIMRRQQEADAAARAARREIIRLTPSPVAPPPSTAPPIRMPEPDPGTRNVGRSVYAPQPSRPSDPQTWNGMPTMPLETPTKYEDDSSTDVEGTKGSSWSRHRGAEQTPKSKVPGYAVSAPFVPSVLTTRVACHTPRLSRPPPPPHRSSDRLNTLHSCHSTSLNKATYLLYSPCSPPLPRHNRQIRHFCSSPNLRAAHSTTTLFLASLPHSHPSFRHIPPTCRFPTRTNPRPFRTLPPTPTPHRTQANVAPLHDPRHKRKPRPHHTTSTTTTNAYETPPCPAARPRVPPRRHGSCPGAPRTRKCRSCGRSSSRATA